MTNTENLYERIAKQEGFTYYDDEGGCFYLLDKRDGYPLGAIRHAEMTVMLIEKYKIDCDWTGEGWECFPQRSPAVFDKNLENAVMLAALSISEGE